MNDKPGKRGEPTGEAKTGPEREERSPRAEEPVPRAEERMPRAEEKAPGKEQKKKPGDAARKMRAMFKG
ncbi:hypothetical protein E1293_45455 [Actinomadura darangshiensis]|uniref:Uncharacterized protein n=1 Tax=Actinomadura darangshiensis TaxID=705336 RepID=A0A4V6PE88_9ACTN|nr:hypothetical protein [Actinomadura darangshiensis]TDD60807.1 hypothetical protein E1293_45455 [Actinomadura darangshiensis]